MALKQAMTPEFRMYQRQVVANCRALAAALMELGYKIVTGTTETQVNTPACCDPLLLTPPGRVWL